MEVLQVPNTPGERCKHLWIDRLQPGPAVGGPRGGSPPGGAVCPGARGAAGDTEDRPTGRIRGTRALLTTA
ncbi:hypothetical protein MXD60_27920, partial [Frankia sp. AgB32]